MTTAANTNTPSSPEADMPLKASVPAPAPAAPPAPTDMTGIEYRVYGPPGCGKPLISAARHTPPWTRTGSRWYYPLPGPPPWKSPTAACPWPRMKRAPPLLLLEAAGTACPGRGRQAHQRMERSSSRPGSVPYPQPHGGSRQPGLRRRPAARRSGHRPLPTAPLSHGAHDLQERLSGTLRPNQGSLEARKEPADFNDLIDHALRDYPAAPTKPEAIFADETQVLDYQQMALLRRWGKAAGRLVVIGDPNQNLYRWRGSDPECPPFAPGPDPGIEPHLPGVPGGAPPGLGLDQPLPRPLQRRIPPGKPRENSASSSWVTASTAIPTTSCRILGSRPTGCWRICSNTWIKTDR